MDGGNIWVKAGSIRTPGLPTIHLSGVSGVFSCGWGGTRFPRSWPECMPTDRSLACLWWLDGACRAHYHADSLEGRIRFEHQQMDALGEETQIVRQCWRVATLWYNWVEPRGIEYPQGIEGTWMRIWELVFTIHGVQYTQPTTLAQLLAPPPPPPTGGVLSPQPLAIAGHSSESSNSVTGPICH